MEPQIERLACNLPSLGETVHHTADRLGALLIQDVQGVFRRIAHMNDQGLAGGYRCADMAPETVTLPLRPVLLPVIIETGFTDGNYLRVPGKFDQTCFVRLFDIGIFGMDAHGGVEVRVSLGKRQNAREIFQIDADADRAGRNRG